jgi:hypothetical protein
MLAQKLSPKFIGTRRSTFFGGSKGDDVTFLPFRNILYQGRPIHQKHI